VQAAGQIDLVVHASGHPLRNLALKQTFEQWPRDDVGEPGCGFVVTFSRFCRG